MSAFDENYYETHEDTLQQEYIDYLEENNLTEDELTFLEFVEEL